MQKRWSEKDSRRRFAALQGEHFPAGAVRDAAMLDATAMTNLLSKTSLILCSETAGQGRARQFCLVDVYQLALLRKLSSLTGRIAWSVDALNRFLFSEVYARGPLPGAKVAEFPETIKLRSDFCSDINSLPYQYTDRGRDPWFFYISDEELLSPIPAILMNGQLHKDRDRIINALECSGVFINITYMLEQIDACIIHYMGIPLGDA